MKILLTNKWMRNLGGSELVTLELAEEFQRQGHEVLIYTEQAGGVLDITVPYTTKRPDTDGFDLLWIHHNMLIHDLGFRKRLSQRIVFNHMSSYVRLEFPKLPSYENVLADWILCNSQETREAMEWAGLREVELFQNPAPLSWEGVGYSRFSKPLLISNHPPVELSGVRGTRVGADRPMRVTPDMMAEASCVVCNGKSVQMALRAGVPVYIYDHFYGDGWLTEENFEINEKNNFSGRPYKRKTAEQIQEELNYIPPPLHCPDRFKLEYVLKELGIC
jgi:glycosyltransferase involved in cell wall biosynthesis